MPGGIFSDKLIIFRVNTNLTFGPFICSLNMLLLVGPFFCTY